MRPMVSSPTLARYFESEVARREFVRGIFDACAPDYDQICRVAALGSGQHYRREALERAGLRQGMRLLDVATGTGLTASEALAVVGTFGIVVGVDPSYGMLRQARRVGYGVVQGVGEALPFAPRLFDMISMGYALRHVADLDVTLRDFWRVLKPGGRLVILEVTPPRSRAGTWLLRQYFQRLVPLMALVATRRAGSKSLMAYYWDTIANCVAPGTILDALRTSGFHDVERRVICRVFNEYTATRR